MKKTLHVISLTQRAGLEVMFLNYLKHMRNQDPTFIEKQYVLAINISEYFKKELSEIGVKIYEYYKKSRIDFSILKFANKILKENEIEIVYGQNFVGNLIAVLLGSFNKNIFKICHEHGTAWNAKGITAILTRYLTKKADLIICNSRASQILLQKRFNADFKKLKVIYNGVPTRMKVDISKEKKRILFVGRLEIIKSPHTLIYMMKHLIEYDNEIVLDIVGSGSLERDLKMLVNEMGLSSNIIFHGNVENVDFFMARANLLILPSLRESLGNVIIEAAFQNTPAVATNVDGIPEVIIDKVTGVLINPKEIIYHKTPVHKVVNINNKKMQRPMSPSAKELAKVVYEILIDDEKLYEMGQNAYNFVIKKFSMENYYRSIVKEFI